MALWGDEGWHFEETEAGTLGRRSWHFGETGVALWGDDDEDFLRIKAEK